MAIASSLAQGRTLDVRPSRARRTRMKTPHFRIGGARSRGEASAARPAPDGIPAPRAAAGGRGSAHSAGSPTIECRHRRATGGLPGISARRDRIIGGRHRGALARRGEPAGRFPRADRDRAASGPPPPQSSARDSRPSCDAARPSGRGAEQVRGWHLDQDLLHEALAAYWGINRTEGRVIDIVDRTGRISASQLGAEVRLTPGAVTAVVDWLEAAGLVRRVRDTVDRRRSSSRSRTNRSAVLLYPDRGFGLALPLACRRRATATHYECRLAHAHSSLSRRG
jgi:hypothetical protein